MATEEEHEKWFIELPIEKCIELLRVRTDKFIGNESTIDGYDGWLNYFKTLPITEITPLAPIAAKSTVSASSPEITAKFCGALAIIS